MIIDNKNRSETESWPLSPMVSFAKSLRMEQVQNPASSNDQPQAPVDPFANIDLDDLPTDIKENITKAQAAFSESQKAVVEHQKQAQSAQDFARQQQSRADQATAKLKAHNLDGDNVQSGNPENNPTYKAMLAKFTSDGLKPEQASVYAKLFVSAGEIQREALLGEVGAGLQPLAQNVGQVQAERAMEAFFAEDKIGLSQIESVQKSLQENIALFVKNNRPVDKDVVKNLANIALGEYITSGGAMPSSQPQMQSQPKKFTWPTIGNSVVLPGMLQQNGGPVMPNEDTSRAVAATLAYLKPKSSKK